MLILKATRGGVELPNRTSFFAPRPQLTNQLIKIYKAMAKKKPIKENKARIKTVLATLKDTTILLQGSKNKIIVKVSVVAATIIAGVNLLIELL